MKANPSLSGVVIDKNCSLVPLRLVTQSRIKLSLKRLMKEYEAKNDDLKDILVDKLILLLKVRFVRGVKVILMLKSLLRVVSSLRLHLRILSMMASKATTGLKTNIQMVWFRCLS